VHLIGKLSLALFRGMRMPLDAAGGSAREELTLFNRQLEAAAADGDEAHLAYARLEKPAALLDAAMRELSVEKAWHDAAITA
jgi:hypothetical protein